MIQKTIKSSFYPVVAAITAFSLSVSLTGCSSIISHTQSGHEEEIHAQRTLGTALDDNAIAGKIEAKLRALNEQFSAMVEVDAYNKIVLLTGRVPDQGFIDKAIDIASRVPGVRQVHSEISQGQPTTISNYWYDAWLTTKVKSQLTLTSNAPAAKTKVRSFAGYVYLMGVMTPKEAKNAIYVASRIPGAKKIISMIETVDETGQAIVAQQPSRKQAAPEMQIQTRPQSQGTVPVSAPQYDSSPFYMPPIEDENPTQNQGFQEELQLNDNSKYFKQDSPPLSDLRLKNTRPNSSSDSTANTDAGGFNNNYQSPAGFSPQEVESY